MCAFHHDDRIPDAMFLLLLPDHLHCGIKEDALVLDGLWFDKQIPKVVGHHPLRAMLGGIDTDNGKVLTTCFLNTRTYCSIWLLQRLPAGSAFLLHTTGSSNVVRHFGFSINWKVKV